MVRTLERSKTARPATKLANDQVRWAAVEARDTSADGRFVYAVKSTGVYCRPSCPARLAKRSNVIFHATCSDAEAAGFRPCKRCTPNAASLTQRQTKTVAEACRAIETADETPALDTLAAAAGLSPHHFHRIFRAVTGVTPKAYALAHRQKRVRRTLKDSASVTNAIFDAGYNSSGRFYEASTETLGMTPSDFRAGGRNAIMRFAAGKCSLGSIVVAASEKGIAAIVIGDDPNALLREVQDWFPAARFIDDDRDFEKVVAKVVAFVEQPRKTFDLPLDIQGTAFQHRVWKALRDIPLGTTVTYTDIAKRVGKPKAIRAVGSACGANKIAIAIPCHRVVRTDGSLSGYRWGLKVKRALIDRESKS